MQGRFESRRGVYQQTFQDPTSWREESGSQIRKENRMEQLHRKRQMYLADEQVTGDNKATAQEASLSSEEIKFHCERLTTGNDEEILASLQKLRAALCLSVDVPCDEILFHNGIERLIPFLANPNDDILFEAAWCLTNIASGEAKHTEPLVDAGGTEAFIRLLSHPRQNVREQAIWGIGNISGDRVQYRDRLIELNLLEVLHELMTDTDGSNGAEKLGFYRNSAWVCTNLLRYKPSPPLEKCHLAADILYKIMNTVDESECLSDCCWALSFLTDGAPYEPAALERINYVLLLGVGFKIVENLKSTRHTVKIPALRTVGNIVTGTEEQTQAMILCGCLIPLHFIIKSPGPKHLKREAIWAISNITAGSREQIQAVIHANIFEVLADLLQHSDLDLKKEVVWAISNACSGGAQEQVQFVVESGFLPHMIVMMDQNDIRLNMVILDCIDALLRAGQTQMNFNRSDHNEYADLLEQVGGYDALEKICTMPPQATQFQSLIEKANYIIKTFLDTEEEDDDAPPTAATETNWNF